MSNDLVQILHAPLSQLHSSLRATVAEGVDDNENRVLMFSDSFESGNDIEKEIENDSEYELEE